MRTLLDLIAQSLTYPVAGSEKMVSAAADAVRDADLPEISDELAGTLDELATWLDETPLGKAEERYTQVFDLSPVCTLNLGFHIFGESYERGALLAGLTRELIVAEIDFEDELPDHLRLLLTLLGRLPSDDDRQLLLDNVLIPGLRKVTKQLKSSNDGWSRSLTLLPRFLEELALREGIELTPEGPPQPQRLPVLDDRPFGPYQEAPSA